MHEQDGSVGTQGSARVAGPVGSEVLTAWWDNDKGDEMVLGGGGGGGGGEGGGGLTGA